MRCTKVHRENADTVLAKLSVADEEVSSRDSNRLQEIYFRSILNEMWQIT
jgi:hypothetical protein